MVAIVTDNKDPEGNARVKLKLPTQEGQNETGWARIATLMAGKDRGSLFIPEVGDEVLVGFLMGDIRHPYVLGMLWSSKESPPKQDDKNNIRKFKSRSGHEITFDDHDSNGKVFVKTKNGQQIELADKTDTIKLSEKSGSNAIEIVGGTKNEVTMKSGTSTISMDSKGDITVSSNKKITIKSTEISIEAKGQVNIKGGAAVNIKSDGLLNIKGSMVKIN